MMQKTCHKANGKVDKKPKKGHYTKGCTCFVRGDILKKAYVFLADGFEEIEAICPVDIMRRAGIDVVTVGICGKTVTGAHAVPVVADVYEENFVLPKDASLVFLPGGKGTQNLANSQMVANALKKAADMNILIAAICAAPTVLQKAGLLLGKKVTAFPGVQNQLKGCTVTGAPVEKDGNIITGRSAGVVFIFAGVLVAALLGQEKANMAISQMYIET